MSGLFWCEPDVGLEKTYADFIHDLKSDDSKSEHAYHLALQLVRGVYWDANIDVRDLQKNRFPSLPVESVSDSRDLGRVLERSSASVILTTSGTTGEAKMVGQGLPSLLRGVRTSAERVSDCWALTYSLQRIAGIQVLLQALANGSSIVNLAGRPGRSAVETIKSANVTHVSATPTYYRILMSAVEKSGLPGVKQVTCGGERLDRRTFEALKNFFPNARIRNVYASTEAGSLFVSDSEVFEVPHRLKDKITVLNGILHFHRSLAGKGVDGGSADEYISTGDLVDVHSWNPLKFTFESRESDRIVVGGNNVNPLDVEAVLVEIVGIREARVYGRSNSVTGQIVACDIVCRDGFEIDSVQLRRQLIGKLRTHEIPRVVNIVSDIPVNETGKKIRRASVEGQQRTAGTVNPMPTVLES